MKSVVEDRKKLQYLLNKKSYEEAYSTAKEIRAREDAIESDYFDYLVVECVTGKMNQNTKPELIKLLKTCRNISSYLSSIFIILNALKDEKLLLDLINQVNVQLGEKEKKVRLLIGKQLLTMNQTEKLLPIINILLENHSEDIKVLELGTKFFIKVKIWEKAKKYMLILKNVNKNEETHNQLLASLAHIEYYLFNYSRTLEILLELKKKLVKFKSTDNYIFLETYIRLGKRENAWSLVKEILTVNPEDTFGLHYCGFLSLEENNYDKALEYFLQIKKTGSKSLFALFAVYFSNKEYKRSYEFYLDWRDSCAEGVSVQGILDKKTQWRGESLRGKVVFLQCEQGKGDTIQFMRYIELLKEAKKIVILCRPREEELIESSIFFDYSNIELTFSSSVKKIQYNYQITMMCILSSLGNNPIESPVDIPYLKPIKEYKDKWVNYFKKFDGKLKIGFSWKGSPEYRSDWKRSLHKQEIFSIIDAFKGNAEVQFFSCQVADLSEADEKKLTEYKNDIIDLKEKFTNYRESIAALNCFDLIISPDSSITHIGGALNKKTFLFLPFYRDWRWLRSDDTESIWYPSVRIFSQKQYNNYLPVMQEIIDAVKKLIYNYNSKY